MANLTSPLMADHAFEVWELEFNSKFGYYLNLGFAALNDHKYGEDADDTYFHRTTFVNMARVAVSMDGRPEFWNANFNMRVTCQQRQESMFSKYKGAARNKGLSAPLIADGVWGAAHHNLHVLHTAEDRTIFVEVKSTLLSTSSDYYVLLFVFT